MQHATAARTNKRPRHIDAPHGRLKSVSWAKQHICLGNRTVCQRETSGSQRMATKHGVLWCAFKTWGISSHQKAGNTPPALGVGGLKHRLQTHLH